MKKFPLASLTAIAVFIICMAAIFVPEGGQMESVGMVVCGIYAFVCLLFLIFQLYAFVRAHTDYDEETERIKYKVFEAEGISLTEVKGDHEI